MKTARPARFAGRWRSVFVIVSCALLLGCGTSVTKSPDAVALPPSQDAMPATVDANWPGWRGSNTSGIAQGHSLPSTLTKAVLWKIAVPGLGNSSPVIWGDRLYLTTVVDNSLAVLAIDCGSGKLLWRTDIATATGSTHTKNGHASASIAIDGERLFAFFGSAGLFAFDLDGEQLWRRELGQLEHIWGTASSPVLYQDLVIQLCDSKEKSCLAAFRKSTGEPAWRTDRDSHGCWTTPVFVNVPAADGQPERTEMVVNGTGTSDGSDGWVITYNPVDGKELWRVRGTTDIVCPTAILGAGLVVSTSGRNGAIIAIRPGGSGDVTASHVVWKARRGGPYVPTGLAYQNRLYLVSDGGVLTSHNLGDGSPIWQHRLKGAFTASLVAGDNKIYAISERGNLVVVEADDEFTILSEESLDERALATPAISAGRIYVRTEGHLYCCGR